MKKLLFLLACFTMVACSSSDSKWYLGEWQDIENGESLYLKPGSCFIPAVWEYETDYEAPVSYQTQEGTENVKVSWKNNDRSDYMIVNKEEKTLTQYVEGARAICVYRKVEKSNDEEKSKQETKVGEFKKDKSNSKSSKSGNKADKQWKSAFEENDGYLILCSSKKYQHRWDNTARPNYFILKGYGNSFKQGMVGYVSCGTYLSAVGLYRMEDDVLILYDLRGSYSSATKNKEPFPFGVKEQIYPLQFSNNISFSGSVQGNYDTYSSQSWAESGLSKTADYFRY